MVQNVYVSAVTADNISRTELIAWINDCLQSSFAKIEELSTGEAYCLFTDLLFPASVQLKKVKWNSRKEVDHLNNWKVLQTSWKNIGVDKPVPVERLIKAKFQDNFEFAQWFKKFFDANYSGNEYDPVAARGGEPLPAGKSAAARPAAARVAPVRASVPARAPIAPMTRPAAAVAPARAPAPAPSQEIVEYQNRCAELEEQLTSLLETCKLLEHDRDGYFERLRKVEDACNGEPENDQFQRILKILYDEDETAAEPADVEPVVAAAAAAAAKPELDDDETF